MKRAASWCMASRRAAIARHEVPWGDLNALRTALRTCIRGVGAARMEHAAAGRINGGGQVAGQHDALSFIAGINRGYGGQKRLGVGMHRMGKQLLRRRFLHQMAQIHYAHAVGDILHHAHVVGDEQVGQPALLLQILHQVDDLGLNGHIQRGDRLIAHDHLGVQNHRPRQTDALPLTARKLVGIAVFNGIYEETCGFLRKKRAGCQISFGFSAAGCFHACGAAMVGKPRMRDAKKSCRRFQRQPRNGAYFMAAT